MNHCSRDLPIPVSPPAMSVRKSDGPRLRFSAYSGCFICAAVLAYGARYWPLGIFMDLSASSSASSFGNFIKSRRWLGRNMWMIQLARKTSTADRTMGNHSETRGTMTYSLLFIIRACGTRAILVLAPVHDNKGGPGVVAGCASSV